jgi:hypothetical protein
MNELQKQIIATALKWLYKKQAGITWENKGQNTGDTINELRLAYGDIKLNKPEAWCALFAYVCTKEATEKVGAFNILPKTLGAKDMLTKSRKVNNLMVKSEPDLGCVFYRKSKDPNSSGHVGIVVKITDTAIYTIEGNANDRMAMVKYPLDMVALPFWNFNFIWTGRLPYTGKSSVTEKEVTIQVEDTTKSKYNITQEETFENVSTTDVNKKLNKKKRKKEFN